MRLAAIDVGTNTVRLLVADDHTDVERGLQITRLGQGVDAARRLAPEAIERTASAVASFVSRARELGASRIRIAGTSALRDAANADEFFEAVRQTALELEVLDGAEEGRLAFLGATTALDGGPFVVCDVGGGSTELVTVDAARSLDMGSVRVRERFLRSDTPTPDEIAAAREFVRGLLGGVDGISGKEKLVGVAGTVTTLAAIELDLERYEPDLVHGSWLPAERVASWTARLLTMPVERVRELPAMHPGRADVIASGALVLDEVVRAWSFPGVLVSEHDILDGLVLDLGTRIA